MRKGFKTMFIILFSIILIALILFLTILPPSKGKVKPFLDAKGKVIDGSIAEKVFVQINNDTQGMIIRGENTNNPVLFFFVWWSWHSRILAFTRVSNRFRKTFYCMLLEL